MADNGVLVCLKRGLEVPDSLQKQLTEVALRKLRRNRLRILRRKRSKLKYRRRRKQLRFNRKSDDLCSTISVFDITDMDLQQSFVEPHQEVAAWQHQHQLAYWKSRAMALEFENRMLHKHIRDVYSQQIQDYAQYMNEQLQGEGRDYEEEEDLYKSNKLQNREPKELKVWAAPDDRARKQKQEWMIAQYGPMAPKIGGMETAIQLNYDLYVEKHNPSPWPNIPLKL